MATEIADMKALRRSLGALPEPALTETADSIAGRFNFPVFSHREVGDGCDPHCYGGWRDRECVIPKLDDPHLVHRCICGARWDESVDA